MVQQLRLRRATRLWLTRLDRKARDADLRVRCRVLLKLHAGQSPHRAAREIGRAVDRVPHRSAIPGRGGSEPVRWPGRQWPAQGEPGGVLRDRRDPARHATGSWVSADQLDAGAAGPGDRRAAPRESLARPRGEGGEATGRALGTVSTGGVLSVAGGAPEAASGAVAAPGAAARAARGGGLCRRGGPSSEPQDRPRLDAAGYAAPGGHAGQEPEALPGRRLRSAPAAVRRRRRRPQGHLAVPEPAARQWPAGHFFDTP